MKAFHGDQAIKDKYVDRVEAHRLADELIQRATWTGKKGCAIGCTLNSYDHKAYENELGIPEWLAKVEDAIFEGLFTERAMLWPGEFLLAISPGVDLEQVRVPFLIFVMESAIESMRSAEFDRDQFPEIKRVQDEAERAIRLMIEAHKSGNEVDLSAAASAAESAVSAARRAASAAASAAEGAAWGAAESAVSAAASAAESTAWSAAASAAESAVSAAASAAASMAESAAWGAAESAVRRAAWSAAESAAEGAESAARSAVYEKFADHLLKLLSEAA